MVSDDPSHSTPHARFEASHESIERGYVPVLNRRQKLLVGSHARRPLPALTPWGGPEFTGEPPLFFRGARAGPPTGLGRLGGLCRIPPTGSDAYQTEQTFVWSLVVLARPLSPLMEMR